MNLVFMNSLERKMNDEQVETAQLLIQESEGVWQVLWHELNGMGAREPEHWFEGRSWDEMLAVFRYRLAEKLASGFVPLLDHMFESNEGGVGRMKQTQMLVYYSEMNEQENMFQSLRKWRTELATKEGKAPYLIASNRVLRMISTFLPVTHAELLQIPGMGEKKVERYGNDIITMTKTIERLHTFPLDWVFQEVDQQQFSQWIYKQKEEKYKQEMDKHTHKKEILKAIQNGGNLSEIATTTGLSRRDLVIRIEQLEQEGYDVEPIVSSGLDQISEEEIKLAWQAFESLGAQYLKPILQKVYNEEQISKLNLEETYEWLRLLRIKYRKHIDLKDSQAS